MYSTCLFCKKGGDIFMVQPQKLPFLLIKWLIFGNFIQFNIIQGRGDKDGKETFLNIFIMHFLLWNHKNVFYAFKIKFNLKGQFLRF